MLYSLHCSTLTFFQQACIMFIKIMKPFSTHTKILKEVGIYCHIFSLIPPNYKDSLMPCMPKWPARTVCVCVCVCVCVHTKLTLRKDGLTDTWAPKSLLHKGYKSEFMKGGEVNLNGLKLNLYQSAPYKSSRDSITHRFQKRCHTNSRVCSVCCTNMWRCCALENRQMTPKCL